MKNKIQKIVMILFVGLMMGSCDREKLDTFSTDESVYFLWSVEERSRGKGTIDSLEVSFSFDDPDVEEKTVAIPVAVLGNVTSTDRTYKVEVAPQSTAIEGEHFVMPENTFIKLGQAVDSLSILLKRTPDMQENIYSIVLELMPNENFNTDMSSIEEDDGNESLSFIEFELSVHDILTQPEGWFEPYLGDFSRKKLFLINEVMGYPISDFQEVAGIPVADLAYIGSFMKRYLADKKAEGETIYEEDGNEMEMGDFA